MTQFEALAVGKRYRVNVTTVDIKMCFVGRLQVKMDMPQHLCKRVIFDQLDLTIDNEAAGELNFEEVL